MIAKEHLGFREVHCCVNFVPSFTAIGDCAVPFNGLRFAQMASTGESGPGISNGTAGRVLSFSFFLSFHLIRYREGPTRHRGKMSPGDSYRRKEIDRSGPGGNGTVDRFGRLTVRARLAKPYTINFYSREVFRRASPRMCVT